MSFFSSGNVGQGHVWLNAGLRCVHRLPEISGQLAWVQKLPGSGASVSVPSWQFKKSDCGGRGPWWDFQLQSCCRLNSIMCLTALLTSRPWSKHSTVHLKLQGKLTSSVRNSICSSGRSVYLMFPVSIALFRQETSPVCWVSSSGHTEGLQLNNSSPVDGRLCLKPHNLYQQQVTPWQVLIRQTSFINTNQNRSFTRSNRSWWSVYRGTGPQWIWKWRPRRDP